MPVLARNLEPFNMPHDPRILIKVLGPAILNILYFLDPRFISVVFSFVIFSPTTKYGICNSVKLEINSMYLIAQVCFLTFQF